MMQRHAAASRDRPFEAGILCSWSFPCGFLFFSCLTERGRTEERADGAAPFFPDLQSMDAHLAWERTTGSSAIRILFMDDAFDLTFVP